MEVSRVGISAGVIRRAFLEFIHGTRGVIGRIPRKTAGPESTVLINNDIGYDSKGGVCILRNVLIDVYKRQLLNGTNRAYSFGY